MAAIHGREVVAMLMVSAENWGTADAGSTGDGIRILDESFEQSIEHLLDDSLGQAFITADDEGARTAAGSLNGYLRYESFEAGIAMVMGAATTPTLVKEVTRITCVADSAGHLQETWFKIFNASAHFYVWIDIGGSGTDPGVAPGEPSGTDIEVGSLPKGSSAGTVAAYVGSAIDASSGFDAVVSGSVVTVTADDGGAATDAYDGGSTGFTIAVTRQGNSTACEGMIYPATDIIGTFGTLAVLKKSDKVFEFPSVKLNGLTVSFEAYQPATITLDGIASHLLIDSTTNTFSTMENVTTPNDSDENRIIMNEDTVFRINNASSAGVDSSSFNIYPTGGEITFNRPMAAYHQADGNVFIAEPADDGFPEAMLTLRFPRYNDANTVYFTNWDAWTDKKMIIRFTGKTISSTYKYEQAWYFPKMKVMNPKAAVGGPGSVPMELQFQLLGATTAPTGMAATDLLSAVTQPMAVYYMNKRSSAIL